MVHVCVATSNQISSKTQDNKMVVPQARQQLGCMGCLNLLRCLPIVPVIGLVVYIRTLFLVPSALEHAVSLLSVASVSVDRLSDNNAGGKDIVCNIDSDKRGFLRKELRTPCLQQGYSIVLLEGSWRCLPSHGVS
jgi:hypothetical protein